MKVQLFPGNEVTCRHTLMLLGFLGLAILYALRVNLSVAIVAMVQHTRLSEKSLLESCPVTSNEKSRSLAKVTQNNTSITGEFTWDEKTQGDILGSFFHGYVLTNLLGGRLADKYGGRRVFGMGIILTALLAIVLPSAARVSKECFMYLRLLQGMTEGVVFPSINSVMASWVPPSERSYFIARIIGGVQFGTAVTMVSSGWMAQTRFGWPSIFISTGVAGLLWGLAWFMFTSESPSTHPWISETERNYLLQNVGKDKSHKSADVPWSKILTSLPFAAVVLAHFGNNWGFFCLLTELPSYLSSVHHISIKDNGYISAVPYLLMLAVMIIFSNYIDHWTLTNKISIRSARKISTAVGLYGPMCMLLCISSAGCNTWIAVTLICLAIGISGAHVCGFTCGFQELAPNFAGTITGISTTIASIPGFLTPQITGDIINNEPTINQWNKVFVLAAVVYFVTCTFYLCFMSSDVQPWNNGPFYSSPKKSKNESVVKEV